MEKMPALYSENLGSNLGSAVIVLRPQVTYSLSLFHVT